LALPVSIVAINFKQVWKEWTEEKEVAAMLRERDLMSVIAALEGLHSKNRLVVALFDDRQGKMQHEFLGEVLFEDLPISLSSEPVEHTESKQLQENHTKNQIAAPKGSLTVGYSWMPSHHPESRTIRGTLEVKIESASGLVSSDWKKGGFRDVYAVVHCWPKPPDYVENVQQGMQPVVFQTRTVNGLSPVWNETATFDVCWPVNWTLQDASRPLGSKEAAMHESQPAVPSKMTSADVLEIPTATAIEPSKGKTSPKTSPRVRKTGCRTRRIVDAHGRELHKLHKQVNEVHAMLKHLAGHLGSQGHPPPPPFGPSGHPLPSPS
jgi:hypothetical protein